MGFPKDNWNERENLAIVRLEFLVEEPYPLDGDNTFSSHEMMREARNRKAIGHRDL